jgi:hypothetical protein
MVSIGYLLRLEDAVNANITPIQRDGRQVQRGIRGIMVFIQKPGNLVWKHRQNSVLAELVQVPLFQPARARAGPAASGALGHRGALAATRKVSQSIRSVEGRACWSAHVSH